MCNVQCKLCSEHFTLYTVRYIPHCTGCCQVFISPTSLATSLYSMIDSKTTALSVDRSTTPKLMLSTICVNIRWRLSLSCALCGYCPRAEPPSWNTWQLHMLMHCTRCCQVFNSATSIATILYSIMDSQTTAWSVDMYTTQKAHIVYHMCKQHFTLVFFLW